MTESETYAPPRSSFRPGGVHGRCGTVIAAAAMIACTWTAAPAAGGRGRAPYPRSPVLAGIVFDKDTLVTAAPGSDSNHQRQTR